MDQLNPSSPNSAPLTPIGFLERAATVYGDCTSIIYNQTTYTWSQTYQRCIKLASALSSLGLTLGDVVSVVAPNIPALYEMHFAVPMSGAVLNTINTRLDSRITSVLLLHSEAKIVFVDYQSLGVVQEAIGLMGLKPPRLVLIDDKQVVERQSVCPSSSLLLSYEKLVEKGDPGFRWLRPKTEWDPMVLNYTSGTTSAPKGVVHSHRGLFLATLNSLLDWDVAKQPVYLWTLPMFHANGWSFPWGIAALGGTNVCLRKFDAPVIYDALAKHKVTHMCGAPVVLNMLANAPESERKTLPHGVQILTAGSPPPAAVLLRTEALGFTVSHGYGLTETAGLVVSCAWKPAWNRFPATERARLKSRQGVGTLATTAADVVDKETMQSVKRDGQSMGEVVVRGGSVMLGYLKDREATSKCMGKGGWFLTGDVGVMHPDGYMEIKDRSKDVIISGGENMSSVEVESVLYSHPTINEAAVVARHDDFWGETPCAFVCLRASDQRQQQPSAKDIIAFCRERLPHYMVPRTVVFTDELPKTSTGKIQKFALREMAKAMGSSRVSKI